MSTYSSYKHKPKLQMFNSFPSRARVLAEIRRYHMATALLIPLIAFQRLVREIDQDFKFDRRWSKGALLALQTAAEDYIGHVFDLCAIWATHAGRETILLKDMALTIRILDKLWR